MNDAQKFYECLLAKRDLSFGLTLTRNDSKLGEIKLEQWFASLNVSTSKNASGKDIIVCESPWDAAIFLTHQMADYANDDLGGAVRNEIAKSLNLKQCPPISMLFRGQSDPDWKIESSLSRDIASERSIHEHACQRFSSIIEECIKNVVGQPFVDSPSLEAAAQHYQIHTELLDWTIDPLVAIHFANDPPGDPVYGSVYAITLAKLWNRHDFKVILPPPMFERLYVQRGVFVKVDVVPEEFREQCTEVRFRKDPKFRVLRAGVTIEPDEILKPNQFLTNLSEECREWARAHNKWPDNESEKVIRAKRALAALSVQPDDDFKRHLNQDGIGLWVYQSAQFLEALAVGKLDENKLVLNALEPLVMYNPILSTLLASYYYGRFHAFQELGEKFEAESLYAYQLARQISSLLKDVALGNFIPKGPIV